MIDFDWLDFSAAVVVGDEPPPPSAALVCGLLLRVSPPPCILFLFLTSPVLAQVVTSEIDHTLSEKHIVLPGIGEFGDRRACISLSQMQRRASARCGPRLRSPPLLSAHLHRGLICSGTVAPPLTSVRFSVRWGSAQVFRDGAGVRHHAPDGGRAAGVKQGRSARGLRARRAAMPPPPASA